MKSIKTTENNIGQYKIEWKDSSDGRSIYANIKQKNLTPLPEDDALEKAFEQAFIDGIKHWRIYPVNILKGFALSVVVLPEIKTYEHDDMISKIPLMDKEKLISLIMNNNNNNNNRKSAAKSTTKIAANASTTKSDLPATVKTNPKSDSSTTSEGSSMEHGKYF